MKSYNISKGILKEKSKKELMRIIDILQKESDSLAKALGELMKKQEKYRWHDLRKDSSDTPDKLKGRFGDEYYEVVFEDEELNNPRCFFKYDDFDGFGVYRDYYDEKTLGFVDSEFESVSDFMGSKVIAWREIEPFEGDTYE